MAQRHVGNHRMSVGLQPPDAALQGLIRHLPFPLVLFGAGAETGFANDRFAEVFLPGQLDSPWLRALTHDAAGGWRSVALCRRDDRDARVRAQAVEVPAGVLIVIDDSTGQSAPEGYDRLQQRIEELENLSATDRLTGAWNRLQLERIVPMEMSRAERLGQPVTLILLDIDRFKLVNDVHGHLAGDAVLKEFVARIRARMRATDSLFRWGGEEFVLLAIAVGYRGAAVIAENLREVIAATPFGAVGPVTASLGVAEYMSGESAESWFQRADQVLYAAKGGGRDRVHVDRRGASDVAADRPGLGVLRLNWLEAYECGERTIDAQHRELFELANVLIAAAVAQDSTLGSSRSTRAALDALLASVVRHFKDEEAILARHGYARLAEHQRAHAGLLERAGELAAGVDEDEGALGPLVDFLAKDVIARHLFKVDRDFYALFRKECGSGAQ